MGTKSYTSYTERTRFYIELYSSETGELLAFIEGSRLGQVRTGAVTGVAIKYMAHMDSQVAALLGTGFQAETQAEALAAVLPNLREIQVFGREPHQCQEFCQQMTAQLGIRCTPMDSLEATVRHSRVIVTATTAREPILRGAWLSPGDFVAAVGANRLMDREIDEEVIGRAQVVVVEDLHQAQTESGELLYAYERQKFLWKTALPLAAVVSGSALGRPNRDAITLFKSLGIALEDIAVAAVVYERAKELGLGQEL